MRIIFVAAVICLAARSAEAVSHRVVGEHVLDVGGHWEYQIHVTEDPEAGPVDWWGTMIRDIVGEEIIEGYETVLCEETGEIPGVVTSWGNANYYLTSEYLVEVRSEDEEMIYLVRDNDPLEDAPVWVDESDVNRHYGHGKHYGILKDPYYTWDGYRDSYITFLRTESITVPAGTFDCVVVFDRSESHEFLGLWGYTESTVWANPAVGSVKTDEYFWMWDPIEEKAYDGRGTAELTFVSLPGPEKATNPAPINWARSEGVTAELNWSDGGGAYTFDVYFGTDFDDVNDANNPDIAPGRGNQSGVTYEPGLLEYNRTYYWRIDSDNTLTTTKGDVWRFRTEIPELSDDGYVWMEDLAILVSYWLDETCAEPNWCEGTDFNRNGATEFGDFAILGQFWCVDASLVGYWEMDDDGPDTTVLDSSGYGNDGTAQQNTSVLHTAGVIDGALTFNGTSDYIDCGTDASLALTAWSMSAWIYRSSDSGYYERIVSKSNTSGYDYWLQIQPDAVVQAGFVDGGGTPRKVATTETVSLDTWYHVAATWDGSYMKIYIDGQPKATSDDYSSYAPRMSERPFNIGRLGAGGSWYYGYNGAIDDVMMFDRALTGEEVEQLYQQGQD